MYGKKKCIKICDHKYIKSIYGEFCYKNDQNACSYEDDRSSQIITVLGNGQKCEC